MRLKLAGYHSGCECVLIIHAESASDARRQDAFVEALLTQFPGQHSQKLSPQHQSTDQQQQDKLEAGEAHGDFELHFCSVAPRPTDTEPSGTASSITLALLDAHGPGTASSGTATVVGPSNCGALPSAWFAELLLQGTLLRRIMGQDFADISLFFKPNPGHELTWAWIEHASSYAPTTEQIAGAFRSVDLRCTEGALCIGFWGDAGGDMPDILASLESISSCLPSDAKVAYTDAVLPPHWSARLGDCPKGGTLIALRSRRGSQ